MEDIKLNYKAEFNAKYKKNQKVWLCDINLEDFLTSKETKDYDSYIYEVSVSDARVVNLKTLSKGEKSFCVEYRLTENRSGYHNTHIAHEDIIFETRNEAFDYIFNYIDKIINNFERLKDHLCVEKNSIRFKDNI